MKKVPKLEKKGSFNEDAVVGNGRAHGDRRQQSVKGYDA